MKYIYKSWNSFTILDSQISFEDELFRCSRVFNSKWKNEEYKIAFQSESFDVTKMWVNLSVDSDRISNLNVEFKRLPENLLMMLGISFVFFLFSYFTNSLFLFNTIIYLVIVLYGLILYIIGQTILSFDVKSNIVEKSFKFECRSIGNDTGLIYFVDKIKNELNKK